MPPHSKPSNIGIRAVSWKHYTQSSRTMQGFKDRVAKASKAAKTTKQIDDEINRIRQEIARLEKI